MNVKEVSFMNANDETLRSREGRGKED